MNINVIELDINTVQSMKMTQFVIKKIGMGHVHNNSENEIAFSRICCYTEILDTIVESVSSGTRHRGSTYLHYLAVD